MKAALAVVVAALIGMLATIQFASEALSASAAAPGTLPHHISAGFGYAVYRFLDRVAPAAYVEATLAHYELQRGRTGAARHYALRLPESTVKDGLLSRIAAAGGDERLALEYALAAGDSATFAAAADRLAARDPAAAYAMMRALEVRLSLASTHPDALAQTHWQLGLLANRTAWRQVPGSRLQRAWLQRAQRDFDAAVASAPLSGRYAIAAANQADLLNDRAHARALFERAFALDPESADALAGLGVIALEDGDRRAALNYYARARAIDPHSPMALALGRRLR